MKDLSPDDRPREKLLRHGPAALGDNELVALVLGNGCAAPTRWGWRTNCCGARRGPRAGALDGGDLAQVGGIGRARAAQVLAALELGRRTLTHGPGARVQLRSPHDAAAYCCRRSAHGRWSSSASCCSTRKHRVLRTTVVAIGHAELDRRAAARRVSRGGARRGGGGRRVSQSSVRRSHSESGRCGADAAAAAAGVLMGIDVVDHIVLGDARYCSFKEMGQL